MEDKVIKVEERESVSKGCLKRQRNEGKIPGVYYKAGSKPVSFICESKEIKHIEHYKTSILTIQINSKKMKGLIKDIQYNPLTGKVMHFDLMGIDLKKNVIVEVPTVLEGVPVGVKTYGGILEHIQHTIEVECLPTDIPEHIIIDVTELNIGDAVHVSDVQVEKAKILSKSDAVLATVVPPTILKEAEPAAEEEGEEGEKEEAAEPELIQKEKKEEEEKKS